MEQIKNVHVFKVGDTADSDQVARYYNLDDLNEMADTYNSEVHEAPIVWGHDADKKWHTQLSRKTQLANGWISEAYVSDDSLYVNMEVDDATYTAIKSKQLKKRSIGLYPPNAQHNPTPGKWYIRHLALLGAEPPAIKGLEDIVIFSENLVYNDMNKEDAIKQLNDNASEWLALIFKNDGEGFGETIMEFIPTPSQENNWLWNDEDQKYEGQLKDEAGSTYDFSIDKDGESWTTSVKMVQEDAEEALKEETDVDVEAVDEDEQVLNGEDDMDCDCENKEFCDCENKTEMAEESDELKELRDFKEKAEADLAAMKQEVEMSDSEEDDTEEESEELKELRLFKEQAEAEMAKMRKFMEERREADRKAQYASVAQFCESSYEDGYMTEAMMSKDVLVKLLVALLDNQQMTYSDGDKDVSLFDGVKSLISNLPKRVEFSEAVSGRTINAPVVKVPKSYGQVSDESAKEYTAIKQYMETHNMTNFREARKKYRETL